MHGKLSNAVTKFTEIHFHISKTQLDMQQYKQCPFEVNPVAVNQGDGLVDLAVVNLHVLNRESLPAS